MSNSSLVCYTQISPNKNSPRRKKIKGIAIHVVDGNTSVESLGNWFAKSSTQASSNYGISSDGRIGQYVYESDRAWTTATEYDNYGVTIEVANDGGAETGYHVTDKALQSVINLCADICKRNGITKMNWFADKNKTTSFLDNDTSSEGAFYVHRWFGARKACPGDYLYGKHPYICDEVNKILNGGVTPTPTPTPTPSGKATVTYAVKENGQKLPFVNNLDDYAGIENCKVTDVAIKVSSGSVKYQVHVLGGGWLPYVTGCNWADYNNGYAGNGRAIDAIRIVYEGNGRAKYRVSPTGTNQYYDWQYNAETTGGQDGYAGCFGKAIDKLQIVIE